MLDQISEDKLKLQGQFGRLGKAIQWLRQNAELRQNEVASRAGITKAMISSYESGRSQPTLMTLDKILAAVGANLYAFSEALDLVNNRPRQIPPPPNKSFQNIEALKALDLGNLASGEQEAFEQMLVGFRRWLLFLRDSAAGAAFPPRQRSD